MSPTARAAALFGGIGVLAAFVPVPVAVVLALAAAAAVAADAIGVRSAPAVARAVPQVLARGRPHEGVAAVDQAGAGAVRLRQPGLADLRVEPAESDAELRATITPVRRGRHELPGVVARRTGWLGLGRWDHTVTAPVTVEVYPDVVAARRLAAAVRVGRVRDPGRRAQGPLGIGTEFESVRDYSPDDDVRQVNWRATARMGRPMSNQYRVDQEREVVCLLDTGRLTAAPVDAGRTRLDVTLDALTAVATVADEVGDRCGAIAFDDRLLTVVRPSRGGGAKVVRALFAVEPTARDSNFEQAFQAVGRGKRALVLVLTDLLEESAARPLLHAVGTLARHHAVVVASVRDLDVETLPGRRPATTLDVLAAAVAVDVVAARERVVARLRAAGAEVVLAGPDELSAACVGAYLRMEARARL